MSAIPVSGGEAPLEKNPTEKFCLEHNAYLNQSILWELLANYYKQMALEAWSHNYVPMFVTSNSRIARNYARVTYSFLRDWFAKPEVDKNVPVHIIEVGGGHGRFAFLVLRHLLRYRPLWKSVGLPERPFRYVFTDVAEANIVFCESHPALKEFTEAGWLDFAVFDANVKDPPVDMRLSGERIAPGTPLVMICNYVLDSLLTDAFQVSRVDADSPPVYKRSLVSVYSAQREDNFTDPGVIGRMSIAWDWESVDVSGLFNDVAASDESGNLEPLFSGARPVGSVKEAESVKLAKTLLGKMTVKEEEVKKPEAAPSKQAEVYHLQEVLASPLPSGEDGDSGGRRLAYAEEDRHLCYILKHYGDLVQPGSTMSFLLPLGAIQLVDSMRRLSKNRLVLLVGDKGYRDADEFRGAKDPHIAIHGSISFMVNLHAIKLYVESIGGFYAATPYKDTFQVTFLFSCGDPDGFGHSLSSIADDFEDFVPDSLISWQKHCQEGGSPPNIKLLLSLLRYSAYDCDVFYNFRKEFTRQCVQPFIGLRMEADLIGDLELVYSHWYRLRAGEDVADVIAHICMKTGRVDRALFYFNESLRLCPEAVHAATYVNMASCFKALGQLDEACRHAEKALELSPDFVPAVELSNQLKMCQNRQGIAFIGCGSWTVFGALPLFAKDPRVIIRGIFSFNIDDAEKLRKVFQLDEKEPSFKLYSGSTGLQELLERPDVDACVVDVHANLMPSIAPKVWSHKKHLLSRSPLAFTTAGALDLVNKYFAANGEAVQKGGGPIEWHVVSQTREEEAFQEASVKAKLLGQPLSFNVLTVNDAELEAASASSNYSKKETLMLDLLKCIAAVRVILGECSVHCVSARLCSQLSPPPKTTQQITTTNGEEKRDAVGLRLIGWLQYIIPNVDVIVPGTFFCTRHGGDNLIKFEVNFTGGVLTVQHTAMTWKISVTHASNPTTSTDSAHPFCGYQNSHDGWLRQIHSAVDSSSQSPTLSPTSTDNSTEAESPTQGSTEVLPPSTSPRLRRMHNTVQFASTDSAIVEAIALSIKMDGSMMAFNYAGKPQKETEQPKKEKKRNKGGVKAR